MNSFPAPGFKPVVQVKNGRVDREMRVLVQTAAKAPRDGFDPQRPDDPRAIVDALAALVAAGGWAMPGETPSARVTALAVRRSGDEEVHELVLHASACAPDIVRSLVRMFEFLDQQGSVHVRSMSVTEVLPPGVRAAGQAELDARAPASVPFRLRNRFQGDQEVKAMLVQIELDRPDDDPALDALRGLFDTWSVVHNAGAFPGPGIYPASSGGFVESVEPGLAHEVLVEIEHLFGTDASWDPVMRGLARIHADVCPIRSVELR